MKPLNSTHARRSGLRPASKADGIISLNDWFGSNNLIDAASLEALQQIGQHHSYPANVRLTGEGGEPMIGLVLRGYLRFQQDGDDGRRKIVTLLTPGDFLVDRDPKLRRFVLQTATDVTICRFDPTAFQSVVDSSRKLARAIHLLQGIKLDQLCLLTWMLGVLTADERVSAFLALATRFMPYVATGPSAGVLTLDLPRGDIADLLGTTVESISRVIKKLARGGIVKSIGRKGLYIRDLPRLVEAGCLQGTFDLISWPNTMATQ